MTMPPVPQQDRLTLMGLEKAPDCLRECKVQMRNHKGRAVSPDACRRIVDKGYGSNREAPVFMTGIVMDGDTRGKAVRKNRGTDVMSHHVMRATPVIFRLP